MFSTLARDKNKTPVEAKAQRSNSSPHGKAGPDQNPVWQSLALRPSAIQAKLAISQPDDPYEQEADRVADRVMRMASHPAGGRRQQSINSELRSPAPGSRKVQRKCGPCEEEEEGLQRKEQPGQVAAAAAAPPLVGDALSSPGRPLDPVTRSFMEARFGDDFSDVHVHTDTRAADSAQAVKARAFTRGSEIVFGAGQYNVDTNAGLHLLAHELAHVGQQRAELKWRPIVQRVPLPGFSQGPHDTCQPASMLSALIIHDRERADPANPNANMVGICNAALIYLQRNRSAWIAAWSAGGADGLRHFNDSVARLTTIRNDLRPRGSTVSQTQYQDLAVILSEFGGDSDSILRRLSLTEASSDALGETLDEIFTNPLMTGLAPGQVNQVEWYVRTSVINASTRQVSPSVGYHMFLIGRQQSGEWFLSDQGQSQPFETTAPDLATLRRNLVDAEASGRSWIITSPTMRRVPLTWSGSHRMAGQDFTRPHRMLAPPGTFLGEVDAGWTVTGQRISTWDFVGIAYSIADARALFPGTGNGHGFLVGEMPAGVFNVWKTTPVSSSNMSVSGLDTADSAGGLLIQSPPAFLHAWLYLRTSSTPLSGMRSFTVY
jgi:uncharacterized protein DUF4157